MIDVVLFEPEIPPNTGNVIRLCANTGAHLHLIKPMGFDMDDRQLKRAGLDYHEYAPVRVHASLSTYLSECRPDGYDRVFAFTTRATRRFDPAAAPASTTETGFRKGDALLFGPETRGLPDDVLARVPPDNRMRIPMRPHSRSLNLSNAVAVAVYGVWRQLGYPGAAPD